MHAEKADPAWTEGRLSRLLLLDQLAGGSPGWPIGGTGIKLAVKNTAAIYTASRRAHGAPRAQLLF
jgi:hypothetical protein